MHSLRTRPRLDCCALTPVALVVCGLLQGVPVWAQEQAPQPVLRSTPQLNERIPEPVRSQLPTFVDGQSISGQTDVHTVIEGNAVLRRGDTVIHADRIDYDQPQDLARARGQVRINRAGNVFEGPYLEMKVDAFEGFFTQPNFRLLANGAYGQADRADFVDNQHSVITRATYTTCEREPGESWPAWILTADKLSLDNETQTGVASGAVVRFFGVPILPLPTMSFPLTEQRKSGFLPPTIALNNRSGVEYTQPYYWNIAPNRDATFYPTIMARRGLDMGAEFRYLEPSYAGLTRGSYLPGDRLRDRDRWAIASRHAQTTTGLVPGALSLNLDVNRVSDDNYWRDFTGTRAVTSLTQRLLSSDGSVNWGMGYFGATARVLKWQTLQDVTSPIVPPYDRLPQLQGRYTRSSLPLGLDMYVETDYTQFHSERALTLQPNAQRGYLMTQVSRPWQAPGWFFTPRMQWHGSTYAFDAPLTAAGRESAQVGVPTFSLDSGLVFERPISLFGRSLVQTLEPRAFYVYTPFRDQNFLPNYDSARVDFNFATIFTENAYGGHDRISDSNLLTLGATSRLQDQETGAELARFGVAQRLRFKDQRVVLPGEAPVTDRFSDLLLGASAKWSPRWTVDTTVQYNPKTNQSERSTVGARYNPSAYRVISAAYRRQRGLSEQLDMGWQWPLNDLWGDRGQDLGPGRGQGGGRWYSVGRLNYSLRDKKMVNSVLGVEYDGCCWIGRVVLDRIQTGSTGANTRILFQVEFIGFARLGSNALGALKDNIPRYQFLRDRVAEPSRFTNYD